MGITFEYGGKRYTNFDINDPIMRDYLVSALGGEDVLKNILKDIKPSPTMEERQTAVEAAVLEMAGKVYG